jgi:hypothetical protein
MMHKTIVGLAAAAALTATTFAPAPAKADPISAWWLVPAVLGGLFVGAAANRPVYAAPRAEYYGPPQAYYGQPRAQVVYGEPQAQYQPRARVRARY